ncbi:histidine phosphatase family protein [Chloroflexota bacterium]
MTSKPTNYEITFLRHGESVGNADGYFQGQHDFVLTDQGRKQADLLAHRWQKEGAKFDLVISSPLARAKETAEIISEKLGVKLEYDPIWMERDNGILAGVHRDDAPQVHHRPDFIPLYQPIGKTGESEWELYLRAGHALQTLMHHPPGRYLVVSHGGLMNKVYLTIMGLKPQADFRGSGFSFANTGFGQFTFDSINNNWHVLKINDHCHLGNFPPRDFPYRFTLLRHGESVGNLEHRFQGQAEYPLTETGRQQAEILAQRWLDEEIEFERILSSPLARAKQTAEIIGSKLNLEIETDPLLKEVNNGRLAGLTHVEQIEQGIERADQAHMFLPIGETGESWWGLHLRAGRVVQNLMNRPPGHYLVVSHGGMLNYILFNVLGINVQAHDHIPWFRFGNTAFSVLESMPERDYWRVERTSDNTHLD